MLDPAMLLAVYCLLVLAASMFGGRLPRLIRMTHLRTQLLMSGVGGLMLGIALLHLLPHGAEVLGSNTQMGVGALIGLVTMFLLIRLFHTHDHGIPVEADDPPSCDDHSHDHDHHHHSLSHLDHDHDPKGISWTGLFFGLALHTLVDGVALASSVMADAQHGAWLGLAGLGTFLAVALHKPLDAFAITSVMNKQNWSIRYQSIANFAFSLACPLGAGLFYWGAQTFSDHSAALGWGLAISAGFFIGIALADLLPEVAFHDHDRGKLTAALLAGIAIAVAIESLPGHHHGVHDHEMHDHGHADHDMHDHGHADHSGHDHTH